MSPVLTLAWDAERGRSTATRQVGEGSLATGKLEGLGEVEALAVERVGPQARSMVVSW